MGTVPERWSVERYTKQRTSVRGEDRPGNVPCLWTSESVPESYNGYHKKYRKIEHKHSVHP